MTDITLVPEVVLDHAGEWEDGCVSTVAVSFLLFSLQQETDDYGLLILEKPQPLDKLST